MGHSMVAGWVHEATPGHHLALIVRPHVGQAVAVLWAARQGGSSVFFCWVFCRVFR